MNITRTNKEELVDTIAVQLETADYTPSFDKNLKTFAKKVNLPGFRPGMVPLSIVKKRFGKDILGEELIKIANQNLMEYVREHKVLYFGRPVLMDTPEELKPETEDKYTFSFDIGLLPEIDIVLPADKTFYQYNVEITEEVIEQELKWIAKRQGKEIEVEISEIEDELVLNSEADGEITFPIDLLEEVEKNAFLGKKVGDTLTINPVKLLRHREDMLDILELDEENTADLDKDITYTVTKIARFVPAILDEDFFAANYKDSPITNVDDLRKYISLDLSNAMSRDSRNFLINQVFYDLDLKNKIRLPHSFLKLLIQIENEKAKEAEVNYYYFQQLGSIIADVLEVRLLDIANENVTQEDVEKYIKGVLKGNLDLEDAADAEDEQKTEEQLNQVVKSLLEDEKRYQEAFQGTKSEKILNIIKAKYNIVEVSTTLEDFRTKVLAHNELLNQLISSRITELIPASAYPVQEETTTAEVIETATVIEE